MGGDQTVQNLLLSHHQFYSVFQKKPFFKQFMYVLRYRFNLVYHVYDL